MMPQSDFMVVAAIRPGHEGAFRQLLASMNTRPGVVDRHNPVVPFADFDRLHFARLLLLEDQTLADITAYGLPAGDYPLQVAFLGDCDGEAESFVEDLVRRAGDGLRQLFSHCEGFDSNTDLRSWMRMHEHAPSTRYVNFVGRSVMRAREEAKLREAISNHLDFNRAALSRGSAEQARQGVKSFVESELNAGRLKLTPIPPTPVGWLLKKWLNLLIVPLLLLLMLPLLVVASPFLIYQLRRREQSDQVIAPRPDSAHANRLADIEDHEVTNQFTAMGALKPGRFRLWLLRFLLWIINYSARHIYNHGRLARVSTIHFARWVFIDDKHRLVFCSNYDGSLEAYMDDFINKVAFGLNLVFSNGIGYPRTDWLLKGGAKDEQTFKHVLRRHQVPTEVWYNAHSGWTAVELHRNSVIRQGLEKGQMNEQEAREWLGLI